MKRLAVATSLAVILTSCTSTRTLPTTQPIEVRTLTVVLFPWIPDASKDNFASLKKYLTTQFQMNYPDIALTLTIDQNIDTYNSTVQAQLFRADGPDVVELDMVSLGDLVRNGYVAPITYGQPTPFSFASTSVQYSGVTYGIPTWVCSNFWYGRASAAEQENSQSLQYAAVKSGIWDGSWTLPTLYLQAYVQRYGYRDLGPVMAQPPDASVVSGMASIFTGCAVTSANDCLNGVFKAAAPGLPQQEYANGTYLTTTGFSESLFYILNAGGPRSNVIQPMYVTTGAQSFNPLAFTDALVINRAGCVGQCVTDAYTFATFLNSAATRLYIAYSGDASGNAPPRYLSPAAQSFYAQTQVQNDPNYRAFSSTFSGAQPFPNDGLPQQRKVLNAQLCSMLRASIPDACNQP